MEFTGLTDPDFNAYEPRKWQSHLFNRERLEVKQKLAALGRELMHTMVGTDGQLLAIECSVEHPALWNHKQVDAQHLFFTRTEAARKELETLIDKGRSLAALIDDPTPYRKHALLTLMLDHERFEVAFKLHADARVDRQNLERKTADFFQRDRLLHLLRTLPDTYRIGVLSGTLVSSNELDDDRLRALLHDFGVSTSWLYVGQSFDRDDALVRDRVVVETARAALARLLPVYQFVAWTRENDFREVREELRKVEVSRRVQGVNQGDRVRIVRGLLSGKAGVVQKVEQSGQLRLLVGSMSVKVDRGEVAKAD